MSTAAKLLTGKELADGWNVIAAIPKDRDTQTGGVFSESYLIENENGRRAFLKAVDFSSALGADDPARMLEEVTKAFNFERRLLEACGERRMTKVCTPIGQGILNIPEAEAPGVTQYLIFELADGDLRTQMNETKRYELAWRFNALHQVAIGMNQLHTVGIAHQDLKPSNALVFNGHETKVADLGRSIAEGIEAPHQDCEIAGDITYAPPELLYHQIHPDSEVRRYGCDAYLMGSMLCFMVTGAPFTPLVMNFLREEHRPEEWTGTYEGVIPYVRDAFNQAIDCFSSNVSETYRNRLTAALRQLCEPDPLLRGHPRSRAGRERSYSLVRYVALFDLVAKHAEVLRH